MANDSFKTKFSFHGLLIVFLYYIPYLCIWLPARKLFSDLSYCPRWLLIVYIFASIALSATLILVKNLGASPFFRKSRHMSISFILLGIYYILWIYFLLGKSTNLILALARVIGSGFLLFYSIDRKNWISVAIASLVMVLVISIAFVALIG